MSINGDFADSEYGDDYLDQEESLSDTTSEKFDPKADKRAHHNALERKRRDHIKDSFSSLKNAVPTFNGEKVGVGVQKWVGPVPDWNFRFFPFAFDALRKSLLDCLLLIDRSLSASPFSLSPACSFRLTFTPAPLDNAIRRPQGGLRVTYW